MSVYGLRLDWKFPRSSNIAAVAYREEDQALYVRFHNNAIWRYDGVPPVLWAGLLGAGSKGQFFARQIKPTKPATRVG